MPPILPASEFEALVHAHHAAVYRSARRIVLNDADALDVTQRVFLRVLEGKASLAGAREPGHVLRWLAARTALSHLRGANTRKEKEDQHAMERTESRPDNAASRAEARVEVQRQLARLPDELRTAIVLRFQEGWTFARIASEQSCSESSAHDRVQRGLERLRGELSRMGFAGVAAVLPQELALDPASSAVALPAGLEHQLLGLRGAAALNATTKLVASVLALVTVVAVATAAVWLPADREPRREVSELDPEVPFAPKQLPTPALPAGRAAALIAAVAGGTPDRASGSNVNSADASAELVGTLSGRCIDESGAPVAGVSVLAKSLQHAGKFARFNANAISGIDGRFALSVPVSIEGGEEYTLNLRQLDFVPHTREKARALAHETTELGDFALLRSSHDVPGDSTLELLVLDSAGAPVPHTIVTALRRVKGKDGTLHEESEASATTDVTGRVTLSFQRLGIKSLHVLPPAGELGGTRLSLGIDAPGRVQRTVTLERGLTISGTMLGIGGTLVHGNGGFLVAYDNAQSPWIMADIDDRSGTFVLRGLEERTYTLVHDGDNWSRALIENVRAGTSGLAIQLKLESDLRDIGDHQAELHGEVHDAKSGLVLLLPAFTIETIRLGDLPSEQWQRDVLPSLIFPRPVQTAMFGEYIPPRAFHLDGLEPGTYAVSARLEGYGPAFAGPFELGRNELRTGIVINLDAPAVLRGVLTDPGGRPLANGFARVTGLGEASIARDRAADLALRATRGQGVIDVWDQVPTDEQGRFEFPALPGWSNLRLVVHHPDFEMAYSKPLELHAGSTTDLGAVPIGTRQHR